MAESSHSTSGPPAKGSECQFNTSPSQIGTPIYFAALLLFNPLTDLPCSFAFAGGFEMIKDSSPKLIASQNASEEDRVSAAAKAAAAAAAAATAEEAKAAEAACCCKLVQFSLQS
jgi:hypothetical protein